jgi:hypothetical protein
MDAGKWWGTYKRLKICASEGCITWPRQVKTVEAIDLCGFGIPIRNSWYEFQENVCAPKISDENCCGQQQLLDRDTVSQFRDFSDDSYIRLYPASATDDGKQILIQGLDINGVPIRTNTGTEWVEGEYVTLASPFVDTVNIFKGPKLTGVQKPVTNERVRAYSVNASTSAETLIATWEPSEEFPQYRRTFLNNLPKCQSNEDKCSASDGCETEAEDCGNIVLNCIVRLQFVPLVVDSDWLIIECFEAMKMMMKSITTENKEEYDQAEIERGKAFRSIRNELEAYQPRYRAVVTSLPEGTARFQSVIGGFW